MAETMKGDTAIKLEMLAVEYDNDGRLADVEASIIRQSRRRPD